MDTWKKQFNLYHSLIIYNAGLYNWCKEERWYILADINFNAWEGKG